MYISVKAFENADPDSEVKAHVNMTIDNAFVVKNLAVVQGKNGLFVNMPHHKSNEVGEDGKAVYMLDQCGMKGFSVGGAKLSDNHANIIINTGEGTFDDFCRLKDIAIERVREKFGVTLEPEVQFWYD